MPTSCFSRLILNYVCIVMCLCVGAYVHMNVDATPSTHTQGSGNAGSCESYDMGPRSQDWVLCKSVTAEGGLSPFHKLIIQ